MINFVLYYLLGIPIEEQLPYIGGALLLLIIIVLCFIYPFLILILVGIFIFLVLIANLNK